MVRDSDLNYSFNAHESTSDNDNSALDSGIHCFEDSRMILKDFSIRIPKLDLPNSYNLVSTKIFSSNLDSMKSMQNNKKSIFSVKSDETLFLNIFKKFISRVENHLPVSMAEIIHKANTNSEFAPVLVRLKSWHSGDVYQKIYARIRTIGYGLRKSNGKNSSNLTLSTKSQLDLTFQTGHHRSIFYLQKDEELFLSVFSDIITRITERKIVRTVDILDRAYSNVRFSPLLHKLKSSLSKSTMNKKLTNKVRTVGYALRKQY